MEQYQQHGDIPFCINTRRKLNFFSVQDKFIIENLRWIISHVAILLNIENEQKTQSAIWKQGFIFDWPFIGGQVKNTN